MQSKITFPNYMQMKQWLPIPVWHGIRLLSVGITIGLCMALLLRPDIGLPILWGMIIPVVPLIFFLAPGVWRNICPLAALNQAPRVFKVTRALVAPKWFKEYGYVIAISLFLMIVPNRKVIFNENGPATAMLILLLLTTAFVMGSFFKGKSGWCSSICPLLPVQRIYGQTPFVTIANSHCQPCVGCTKNCYDFNPRVAYLADLHDDDRYFGNYRKFFVGLFPGFVLAYYILPNPPEISVLSMYGQFVLYAFVSVGTFFLAESFLKVSANKITVVYGAAALNIYYWFNAVNVGKLISEPAPAAFVWGLRAAVLGLTLFWIYRTYQKEAKFVEQTVAPRAAKVGSNMSLVAHRTSQVGSPEVTFKPDDKRIVVEAGRTILEVAESNSLDIEAGCRMGVCGADPVAVLEGLKNMSKISSDEQATLDRLGFAENTRMACVARIKGNACIALKPEKPKQPTSSMIAGAKFDRDLKKLVIIGNGIAGVTAADHARRRHLQCEIHLIGREPHHLYNRMGITRLIYGRSAMQGLYLLPEKWYDDNNITTWLNTFVTKVDAEAKTVHLGTGETLDYDKLILTTGSQSMVPPIDGYGMRGTFVLRTAEDAMAVRSYVQQNVCRNAVIAGGGLLGLEAAYGLHKMGVNTAVLERSATLLKRQLDKRGGQFLQEYLEGVGLNIVTEAETEGVRGNGHINQVVLKDGRTLPCDIFLVCVGIRSDMELAEQLGLEKKRGVIVNEFMQTSQPDIYAAGDVAEFDGKVFGLWPVAVSQAETAAINAIGDEKRYTEIVPSTMLKVVGVDLNSIGRIQAEGEKEFEIALEETDEHRYRKLVIAENKIVGAILLGYPRLSAGVSEAVKGEVDIAAHMDELKAGDWTALVKLAE